MEKLHINATIGYREVANGKTTYFGDTTDNGECYKDWDAWKSGIGVIYISEYQLTDLQSGTCYEDDLWTRASLIDYIREEISFEYPELADNEKLIIAIAEDLLETADWQDLTTLFAEYDYNGTYIENMLKEI